MPILDYFARVNHGSTYKTRPLYEALKVLGSRPLFGGERTNSTDRKFDTKVAVTSTVASGTKAVIIANYNRHGEDWPDMEFRRAEDPKEELLVWEAAAATTAASPFFKAFDHHASKRRYLDGAYFNNNPVYVAHLERRLLWPDVAKQEPDILLSIGTGQDEREIRHKKRERRDSVGTRYVAFSSYHPLTNIETVTTETIVVPTKPKALASLRRHSSSL